MGQELEIGILSAICLAMIGLAVCSRESAGPVAEGPLRLEPVGVDIALEHDFVHGARKAFSLSSTGLSCRKSSANSVYVTPCLWEEGRNQLHTIQGLHSPLL